MAINEKAELRPVVIRNSPIDFILTGPNGGRDKVLVKTEGASIELIGLASSGASRRSERVGLIGNLLGLKHRDLNIVESYPVDDFQPQNDSRQSVMRFAWVSESTESLKEIEREFKDTISDLRNALKKNDLEEVEWSLGVVIFKCNRHLDRPLQRLRFQFAVLAWFFLLVLSTVSMALHTFDRSVGQLEPSHLREIAAENAILRQEIRDLGEKVNQLLKVKEDE